MLGLRVKLKVVPAFCGIEGGAPNKINLLKIKSPSTSAYGGDIKLLTQYFIFSNQSINFKLRKNINSYSSPQLFPQQY